MEGCIFPKVKVFLSYVNAEGECGCVRERLDVLPEGSDSAWRIVESSEGENVSNNDPIGDPAPETQQVTGLAFQLQASTPEAIIRAVGDIMQRTSKPTSDSNLYRRLRTFSGVITTPPEEE